MLRKQSRSKRDRGRRSSISRKASPKKRRGAKPTLKERLARAAKLEALDAGTPVKMSAAAALASQPQAQASHPLRNDDFPDTYIQQISVSMDDPNHWLTLTWTGPNANSQETG